MAGLALVCPGHGSFFAETRKKRKDAEARNGQALTVERQL
jgi:hypothetical protein